MASPLTFSHMPICLRRSSKMGAILPSCVGPIFISRFPPRDTVSTKIWHTWELTEFYLIFPMKIICYFVQMSRDMGKIYKVWGRKTSRWRRLYANKGTEKSRKQRFSPLRAAQWWGSHWGVRFVWSPTTLCQSSYSFPICVWAGVPVDSDQNRYNILRGHKWNHNPTDHWSQLCLELDCDKSQNKNHVKLNKMWLQ